MKDIVAGKYIVSNINGKYLDQFARLNNMII